MIEAYGPPQIQSRLGPREILKYPQGQVVVEDGRVVRWELRGGGVAPAGSPAAPAANPVPAVVSEGWLHDYEVASREAERRKAPMLVWFAGADWSLASRQFRDEVALQGDFVAGFRAHYVLLRVDLPDHNASLRDPNARLRERVGVTVYPTLLILSPAGENLAKIDLSRAAAGEAYSDRVIAAVREMHDLLGFAPLPAAARPVPAAATAHRPVRAVTAGQVTSSLLSAGWEVVTAIGTGLLVTALLLWLVWRKGSRTGPRPRRAVTGGRIAEAASGVPPLAEVMTWSKDRVVVVATGLAECEGFITEPGNAVGECDLRLRRAGEPGVHGLVCCVDSRAGVVTVRRLRHLLAQMMVEQAGLGWFVAPMGFSTEARAFADAHRIRLTDGHRLVAQLHELPPVVLPRVTGHPWARV